MKNKIIFIQPPESNCFDTWKRPFWMFDRFPPTSLLSIMSYIDSKGFDSRLADCREIIYNNKTNDYLPIIGSIINDYKPDIVGLTMVTTTFYESKKIVNYIKEVYPHVLIIVGGPHPSIEPLLTLEQIDGIDAICQGPGEEVVLDLMEGTSLSDINGLMVRNAIEHYKSRPVEKQIDKYPFPSYEKINHTYYTAYSAYTAFGWLMRSLPILTARSCPFSCKFCASDWSKPLRMHSSEYVLAMIQHLAKFDINNLIFLDDMFGVNKNRLIEICEGLIRTGLFIPSGRLRWSAQMRADSTTRELLELMKRAGCYKVSFGVESGSNTALKTLNKKVTVEEYREVFTMVRDAGLCLGGSFMIGIPGETEAEMQETIAFMKEMNSHVVGIGQFRPLPGSPFYNEFIECGRLKKKEIDWENMGNFGIVADEHFHNVDHDTFVKYFDIGKSIANETLISVHEDIRTQCPSLVDEISYYSEVNVYSLDDFVNRIEKKKVADDDELEYRLRSLYIKLRNSTFLQKHHKNIYKFYKGVNSLKSILRHER